MDKEFDSKALATEMRRKLRHLDLSKVPKEELNEVVLD